MKFNFDYIEQQRTTSHLILASAMQSFLFVMLFSEKVWTAQRKLFRTRHASQLLDFLSFYYHVSS